MKLNRIKDTLEEKGISQTWLAKQLGKSFSTLLLSIFRLGNLYGCL